MVEITKDKGVAYSAIFQFFVWGHVNVQVWLLFIQS